MNQFDHERTFSANMRMRCDGSIIDDLVVELPGTARLKAAGGGAVAPTRNLRLSGKILFRHDFGASFIALREKEANIFPVVMWALSVLVG